MIKQLFQITFFHSYFADGKLDNFGILADDATTDIINKYRLLARIDNGIFSLHTVFQEGALGFVTYLSQQAPDLQLRFFLTYDPAEFFFITDLPFDWVGQLALCSASGVACDAGTRLSAVPCERTVNTENVIAIISISLADVLRLGGSKVAYVCDFQARQLRWTYYLVNRSQVKLNQPVIRNQDGYSFLGPEAIVLPSGEKALCFSSGTTVFPLQKNPTVMFDLVDSVALPLQAKDAAIERCLIKSLPTPNQAQLSLRQSARQASDTISCTMHVYL